MLRAFVPGYHPDKIHDPDWVSDWAHAYQNLDGVGLPLLNTSGEIAPEFVNATAR